MPRAGRKGCTLFTPMVRRMASSFLFFHELSKGYPGSQIIVPEKPEVKKDEYWGICV
jgi:hypothetical protein